MPRPRHPQGSRVVDSSPGSKPLVRCAVCSSDLIYPLHCERHGEQCVIDRRCPECESRDRVLPGSGRSRPSVSFVMDK